MTNDKDNPATGAVFEFWASGFSRISSFRFHYCPEGVLSVVATPLGTRVALRTEKQSSPEKTK